MSRHRCRPALFLHAAALAAAAFFCLPIPRAAAQSVNLYVNSAFVATTRNQGVGNFCFPVSGLNGSQYFDCPVCQPPGSVTPPAGPFPQTCGDVSNDPEINFENDSDADPAYSERCVIPGGGLGAPGFGSYPIGDVGYNICNSQVFLCAQVCATGIQADSGGNGSVGVDKMEFEVFRYVDGANPLDPGSTPPLRTFFVNGIQPVAINPAVAANGLGQGCTPQGGPPFFAACVLWDGSQPVQGTFGKINGSYGFRITVQTSQQGASGNVQITDVKAYPLTTTYNSDGVTVGQKPLKVQVMDVHVINSTPTVVGRLTGVAAEPYNFTYRLSQPATMYITINNGAPTGGLYTNVRNVLGSFGEPKPGEGSLGTPTATPLVNGDSWDGRDNAGNVVLPGDYLAVFQANSFNQYTAAPTATMFGDLSNPTTYTVSIDPLQITDIQVSPLLGGATSLAVLSYVLTEPATVYVDVYPPGTQFCNDASGNPALLDVLNPATDAGAGAAFAKNLSAFLGACGGTAVTPIRSISQFQQARTAQISFWDGRDKNGTLVNSGDYVFAIYGALPSQRGVPFNGNPLDRRVWTTTAKVGFISVVRSLIGITQITPTSTVIGSSPPVAGLNPFTFSYQLSRPGIVSMIVYDQTGLNVIKTLVNQETRAGQVTITEPWTDGTNDSGTVVSSGTYLVQLTATDPTFPASVSTTTALFPVDLYRITDVQTTPLLAVAGDTATLSYQLSQPMLIAWNIYPPGSLVVASTTTWPPCPTQSPPGACTSGSVVGPTGLPVPPVITFFGMRPGRLKITETWDGRNPNGLFVPDGQYVFTLTAQSTSTPQFGTIPYFATDRIFGTMTLARGSVGLTANAIPTIPTLFNSSNTLTLPPFSIQYTVTRESSVTVQIVNTAAPPTILASVVAGAIREPGILNTDVWDGRDNNGNFLPFTPGGTSYVVRVTALDVASASTQLSTATININYDPLRIYDTAVTPIVTGSEGTIAYQVSEPMKVSIKIYPPNTIFTGGTVASQPPIKFITGVRPSRTNIKDTWDGTDFTGTRVPDGDYKFVLVGSTDNAAIDSLTGNVLAPSELADDRLVFDIPVTISASADPQADLENNSFIYPNPASGPTATIQIYSPFQAHVTLKLFTMSGRLVFSQDLGQVAPSFQDGPISFVWNKVNSSGRGVARGVYYALIRVEQTLNGTTVLQTVKKVLIP